jgi:hypothetical protein
MSSKSIVKLTVERLIMERLTMMKLAMKKIILWLGLVLLPLGVMAQTDQAKPIATSKTFGEYTVHFSVFNSTLVPEEIAKIYQLTRGSQQVLINVSLTKTADGKTSLGLPGKVSGTATNLIQQQRALEFKTISEGEATYYLASLRHTNEEVMNFAIEVQTDAGQVPMVVKFTRTLHTEN